jgi:hypothetical protein
VDYLKFKANLVQGLLVKYYKEHKVTSPHVDNTVKRLTE